MDAYMMGRLSRDPGTGKQGVAPAGYSSNDGNTMYITVLPHPGPFMYVYKNEILNREMCIFGVHIREDALRNFNDLSDEEKAELCRVDRAVLPFVGCTVGILKLTNGFDDAFADQRSFEFSGAIVEALCEIVVDTVVNPSDVSKPVMDATSLEDVVKGVRAIVEQQKKIMSDASHLVEEGWDFMTEILCMLYNEYPIGMFTFPRKGTVYEKFREEMLQNGPYEALQGNWIENLKEVIW